MTCQLMGGRRGATRGGRRRAGRQGGQARGADTLYSWGGAAVRGGGAAPEVILLELCLIMLVCKGRLDEYLSLSIEFGD